MNMTGINYGSKEVKEIYYGSKKIKEVYYGSKKIWPTNTWLNIPLSGYVQKSQKAIGYNNKQSQFTNGGMNLIIAQNYRSGGDRLYREYDLTSPYDLSTATSVRGNYGYGSYSGEGLFINKDGNILITASARGIGYGQEMATYSIVGGKLPVGSALSTRSAYVGSKHGIDYGIFVSSDGKYLYMNDSNIIWRHEMTTPFYVGTTTNETSYDIGYTVTGLYITFDGKYMYTNSNGTIRKYQLSTPRDVSSKGAELENVSGFLSYGLDFQEGGKYLTTVTTIQNGGKGVVVYEGNENA